MALKKILFIINPISGGKNKQGFTSVAKKFLDLNYYDPTFEFTKNVNHAEALASDGIKRGFKVIVAVGGDGTINEVARAVAGTEVELGIVPKGSGNGLARALNIPLQEKQAIDLLNRGKTINMDIGFINDIPFFNMAGIGFDAVISSRFANVKHRGPLGYLFAICAELRNYKSQEYTIEVDGVSMNKKAFMISIANSPQYGNEAYISPNASLVDGLLDVCVVKPFHWSQFPMMIYSLFNKTADQTNYVDIVLGKSIRITQSRLEGFHVDGEPFQGEKDFEIRIQSNALKVICLEK